MIVVNHRTLGQLLVYILFDHRSRNHPRMPLRMGQYMDWIMTLAEQWFHQGETKGLEQGLEQGRAELLSKQLTLKFGDLSSATQARLTNASSGEIDRWAERVLFAATLEQVLDEPKS